MMLDIAVQMRCRRYSDDVLIRFEVSNYRSIAAPAEISMIAIDRDRPEARDQPMLGESLVPIAAVFGPNASGKSNIIAAFTWVRDAVQHSLRLWDDEIPIEPFAFGVGPSKPSEFIIESTIDGIRFEYVLEVNSEKVMYEGLFHYPEKKRRRIFEREGSDFKLQRGLGGLSGTRELLTERTLALSIARRFDEPLVSSFARDLLRSETRGFAPRRTRGLGVIGSRIGYGPIGYGPAVSDPTWRWFKERDQPTLFGDRELASPPGLDGKDREQALALLRLADRGIDDVVIDTQ
jgi:hypothetical protein